MDLEIEDFPSAEAQVAALSDDIAYSNHDIDDGLRDIVPFKRDVYAAVMGEFRPYLER